MSIGMLPPRKANEVIRMNATRDRRSQGMTILLAGITLLALGNAFSAQGMAVIPLEGQSAQQVKEDTQQCYSTATQSAGYDPGGSRAAQPAVGGRTGGAATGTAAGLQAFETAYRSCLSARGYSVR
jgi:hypothetical protein